VLTGEPSWADFASAAWYRNLLIAEAAERLVAFWYNRSRGTADAIEAAIAAGKSHYIFTEESHESDS
jgi:hypothetical protein